MKYPEKSAFLEIWISVLERFSLQLFWMYRRTSLFFSVEYSVETELCKRKMLVIQFFAKTHDLCRKKVMKKRNVI